MISVLKMDPASSLQKTRPAAVLTHREERCRCGHLLALLDTEGIEMKCKRCKRLHKITLQELSNFIKDRGPLESGSNLTPADICRGTIV